MLADNFQTCMLPVTTDSHKIRFFRQRIPAFECQSGCHDCCGLVTTSSEEMSRLPVISEALHAAALADFNCPHLGSNGCKVYLERPLVCRLFGTTPRLACPNGKRPAVMIDAGVEQQIFAFFKDTRHVLV
jgi:hypothetical protein